MGTYLLEGPQGNESNCYHLGYNMNTRIKQLADEARDWGYAEHSGHTAQLLFEQKFAELIVKECALIAGLMEYEGRKGIGAQILDRFEIPVSSIEAAESFHSDKGYSLGTPEAQEAFERKRGYKL
jgi:hypothetical protein